MKPLYLYLVTRNDGVDENGMREFKGQQLETWDVYLSFVVCAENEEAAAKTHPTGDQTCWQKNEADGWVRNPGETLVRLIGTADGNVKKGELLCFNYKAG